MSRWDKLLSRILSLSKDMRFGELKKVLESYGYEMNAPRSGGTMRSVSRGGIRSQSQSMNRSRRYTSIWFEE